MGPSQTYMRDIGARAHGARAARELLALDGKPDAIFATSIDLFEGAYLAIREMGLAMPNDIALIGFDEPEWSPFAACNPTVIVQPVREIGETAARLLIGQLSGAPQDETSVVRLETRLHVGDTT